MSAMLKQKLIDIANGFTKYGLWKGGGSSALSEMTDVTFSNLQANNILKYNGSVWINDDNLQKQIDTLNSNLSEIPKIRYKEISATTDSNGYVELDVFALSARVLTSAVPGNYTCLIHGYKTTAQNNSNILVVKSAYNMTNIINTNMTFGILYIC